MLVSYGAKMINPRKTHCKRGHKFTSKNEIWFTDINGKLQRKCKRCFNLRKQLRYRTDKAYREKMLSKSRKYKCRLSPVLNLQSQPSQVY